MKKNTQKGFTLVELLVVIAILAILASVAVVGYTSFIDRAKQNKADTEAAQVEDYITFGLIDNAVVELGTNAFIIKNDDGSLVFSSSKTGAVPAAATTFGGELAELKGTLAIGTVGDKTGLVYTVEGKSALVLADVTAYVVPTPAP